MPDDERPVLDYQSTLEPKAAVREFPWGLLSITFGVCAAIVVPVFDALTQVPGFLQGPILMTGEVTAALAFVPGIGALFVRTQRMRGIIGMCLGFIALALLPSLQRA